MLNIDPLIEYMDFLGNAMVFFIECACLLFPVRAWCFLSFLKTQLGNAVFVC